MPAQDPTEPFDLVDPDGRPLGTSKPRAEVHRDGDWHRSIHLWVVLEGDGEPAVLLQRRGLGKDLHPGLVDVSVAGHLRAGEEPRDALREAEEEVGLVVRPDECAALGLRRVVHTGDGVLDREIQHIFLVRTRVGFDALRPAPDEVAGLVLAPLAGLRALVERDEPLTALERDAAGERAVTLPRGALVPSRDRYPERALASIARRLAGEDEPFWRMGWV